jgi:RHS repeat-associated protein
MVSPESVGTGNELTKSPGVTYTYDNNGNMSTATTVSGTTTYTYDYENRLTNVDIHGTMAATYAYDALGRRIGIDDSGTQTWTVFNGKSADANPYADFNSSGTLKMRYLDGLAVDELFARTDSSGNTSWYLTDQVGSVVAIVSTSAVLDQITYDPFGNIVTQTDSAEADRFMFAGMEYDSTTGLYFDHARYYDAAIGRFIGQDPEGFNAGDTNLYRYVFNDVTSNRDPSGLQGPGEGGGGQGLGRGGDAIQKAIDAQGKAITDTGTNPPSRRPVSPPTAPNPGGGHPTSYDEHGYFSGGRGRYRFKPGYVPKKPPAKPAKPSPTPKQGKPVNPQWWDGYPQIQMA